MAQAQSKLNLALADMDTEWSPSAAVERVWEWSGGNFELYWQAFFYRNDEEPDSRESYSLPYADVIDGELKAVPRGIFAAARSLDLEDPGMVQATISEWYAEMRLQFQEDLRPPWEERKMEKFERRWFEPREIRADEKGDTVRISGHAAVFNELSEDLGGFRERILPGAFKNALPRSDVRFLINHSGLPLARSKSGTLRLKEDKVGLRFEADLDRTDPDVQALLPKIKRRDIDQMSFGFVVGQGGDRMEKEEDQEIREIMEFKEVFDVSAVTFPAYPQTELQLREMVKERYGFDPEEVRGDKQTYFLPVQMLTDSISAASANFTIRDIPKNTDSSGTKEIDTPGGEEDKKPGPGRSLDVLKRKVHALQLDQ